MKSEHIFGSVLKLDLDLFLANQIIAKDGNC